jgi:RimJ/RimL family protein N-acetyltransferase
MTVTIKTKRLTLRPLVMGDFPAYRDFLATERARFIGGPLDEKHAWFYFCHDAALWSLFGHGALMIDLNDTGICVGSVGINHGPMYPEKELGWLIYEGHEGAGYATEAAAALRDWAFTTCGLTTLVSYIDPTNTKSVAVAERLGARRDNAAQVQDIDDQVYRHEKLSLSR